MTNTILGTHNGINLIRKEDGSEFYYSTKFAEHFSTITGYDSKLEFKTIHGYCDIAFTSKGEVISLFETKLIKNWKHALGQILAYSMEYPQAVKGLLLVVGCASHQRFSDILNVCRPLGVQPHFVTSQLFYFYDLDNHLQCCNFFTLEEKNNMIVEGFRSGMELLEYNSSVDLEDDNPF